MENGPALKELETKKNYSNTGCWEAEREEATGAGGEHSLAQPQQKARRPSGRQVT